MFLALTAACFLLACGSHSPRVGTGPGGTPPSSSPSFSPSSPAAHEVTNADANRTVTVQPGQVVQIALKADPGFDAWTVPSSTDPSVLVAVVDPRASAAQGMTLASFRALKKGTARLNSQATPHCDVPANSGAACSHLAIGWSTTVQVS
jgi:hypothetical protein